MKITIKKHSKTNPILWDHSGNIFFSAFKKGHRLFEAEMMNNFHEDKKTQRKLKISIFGVVEYCAVHSVKSVI